MISVTINGFKSEKHAKTFMEWFEGQGEQYQEEWFDEHGIEHQDVDVRKINKKPIIDGENINFKMYLKKD